jgi:hypothetical protein
MNQYRFRSLMKLGVAGAAFLSLAACGTLNDALGLDKNPPDEMQVVAQRPLVMPPDYELRPPQPGAPALTDPRPTAEAQAALLPNAAAGASSPAQNAILQGTGGDTADPTIRAVVNAETDGLTTKDEGFVDQLMFWQASGPSDNDPVIDPAAEAERLKRQGTTPSEAPAETPPASPQ